MLDRNFVHYFLASLVKCAMILVDVLLWLCHHELHFFLIFLRNISLVKLQLYLLDNNRITVASITSKIMIMMTCVGKIRIAGKTEGIRSATVRYSWIRRYVDLKNWKHRIMNLLLLHNYKTPGYYWHPFLSFTFLKSVFLYNLSTLLNYCFEGTISLKRPLTL